MRTKTLSTLGLAPLAVALGLLWTAEARPAGDDEREAKAEALLTKAEFRVEKGRYDDARGIYRDLARRYPETRAGKVGQARSQPSAYVGSKVILAHGPPENRIDVGILGDGYTLKHQKAFDKLAEDVLPLFERQVTLREYRPYFNFRRYNMISKDGGVDGFGRDYDTALGARTLSTNAGHVGIDHGLVSRALDEAPDHDGLAIVLVSNGVSGTGGAGHAVIGGRRPKTVIHEWGHAFGRLGDEYSTQQSVGGPPRVNRAANVSETSDPKLVPWAHWIEAKVPGIGVYEGAAQHVRGAWKPTASGCVMLSGEFFCKPCQEALILRIYQIVDPIESVNHPVYPLAHSASLEVRDSFEFEVTVMRPESHNLVVRWWVLPERSAPPAPRAETEKYRTRFGDRRDRGPLSVIQAEPARHDRVNKRGVHRFTVKAKDLEPGRYRVVCRAQDTTRLRGEKWPWVLKDELGLLESERGWWIEVPGRD